MYLRPDLAKRNPIRDRPDFGSIARVNAAAQVGLLKHQSRVCRVAHVYSAPGRNRTCDARLRSPALYPLSYEGGPRSHTTFRIRHKHPTKQRRSRARATQGGMVRYQ